MNLPPEGPCTNGPRKFGGPSARSLAMFTAKSNETVSPESEEGGTRSSLPRCIQNGAPGVGLISVIRSGSERTIAIPHGFNSGLRSFVSLYSQKKQSDCRANRRQPTRVFTMFINMTHFPTSRNNKKHL